MTVARFARAAIAVVLVTIASGMPRAAVALLVDDCCVEQCDGESGGRSCPPDCTSASCVKVVQSAVSPPAATPSSAHDDEGAVLPHASRPLLPDVVGGVFHPPRG